MSDKQPSPLRAHLLRATHEWLTEHGHTPYLQVLVDKFVQVPPEYVRDGAIVLNVSYDSTNKLHIGDEWIEFQARFNGVVREILVPIDHVVSLFSRETQDGYQSITPAEFVAIKEGRYEPPAAQPDALADKPAETPPPQVVATAPPAADKANSTTPKKSGITRIK